MSALRELAAVLDNYAAERPRHRLVPLPSGLIVVPRAGDQGTKHVVDFNHSLEGTRLAAATALGSGTEHKMHDIEIYVRSKYEHDDGPAATRALHRACKEWANWVAYLARNSRLFTEDHPTHSAADLWDTFRREATPRKVITNNCFARALQPAHQIDEKRPCTSAFHAAKHRHRPRTGDGHEREMMQSIACKVRALAAETMAAENSKSRVARLKVFCDSCTRAKEAMRQFVESPSAESKAVEQEIAKTIRAVPSIGTYTSVVHRHPSLCDAVYRRERQRLASACLVLRAFAESEKRSTDVRRKILGSVRETGCAQAVEDVTRALESAADTPARQSAVAARLERIRQIAHESARACADHVASVLATEQRSVAETTMTTLGLDFASPDDPHAYPRASTETLVDRTTREAMTVLRPSTGDRLQGYMDDDIRMLDGPATLEVRTVLDAALGAAGDSLRNHQRQLRQTHGADPSAGPVRGVARVLTEDELEFARSVCLHSDGLSRDPPWHSDEPIPAHPPLLLVIERWNSPMRFS